MAEEEGQRASTREATAPHPDDPRKPDDLTDIEKPSWKYIARKTMREFSSDQCTDLAAALTYFGVLAIFPALLAFVAILGLVGDAEQTTRSLIDLARGFAPNETLDALRDPIENLARSDAAGFALVAGIAGALWSASGYVGAFSRAMNRIYQIQEGRPFWKLRPMTLGVTVLAILVALTATAMLVLSGPVAEVVADGLGLGEFGLAVWNIAKWPILVILAVLLVAVLYYATPNVKQPKFRWMSIGAFVALLTLVVASALFAFYVANFSSYNETYGSIGGIIVFLLWVWIANIALLFGAELDAEIERGRELQAGIPAEETIQLPPRDTKKSDKVAKKHEEDVEKGRALRAQADPDAFAAEQEQARQAEKAEQTETAEARAEQERALKKARRSQSRAQRRVQNRPLKK